MSSEEGKNIWIFPDGELPEPDKNSKLVAHEALMILNTSDKEANLKLTFYFSDKDPIRDIIVKVHANRVKCIRMDHENEIGGITLPRNTQYALRVESDLKVTATFGRLDTSSEKMSFYTSAWYCY